jgi:8-oxo-dGTP diphosphatase
MKNQRFTLRSAVYLLLIKEDKLLLLKRANTGWMDGYYDVPAGHIESNEPITTAMLREAKEEVDISLAKKDLIPGTVMHRKGGDFEYIDFYFIAKKWQGTPVIGEPDKCSDLNWFNLNELPDNLVPYTKKAIENYQNHISFAEFGWEK